MKNVILHKKTLVHPYGAEYHLIVARNTALAARELEKDLFPELDVPSDFTAMAVYDYAAGRFGVFFGTGSLSHCIIGHELLHTTTRILNWVGDEFHIAHSEPYAYINGFLHSWVYKQLRKAGVRVR
jgi:hypothetical protein